MTTHSEDLVSLEELQSMLAAHAGPDNPRTRPSGHRVHGWRPVLVASVAVAALAGAGVGIAGAAGAFEGTPATPQVTKDFTGGNQLSEYANKYFAQADPQADASQAHGVIAVQTPDGPEDLWAAPDDQGGECFFVDFANDPLSDGGQVDVTGGCTTSDLPFEVDGPGWTDRHPDLLTFDGFVSDDAASTVQLTLRDGSTLTLPVVEHFFLGSIAQPATGEGAADVTKATAFDAEGKPVAAVNAELKPVPVADGTQ